ncbi:hypothetical protein AMTR_s00145p00034190 [Amborella trichopoda]|uniref:Uncharacterized protein n=1 Tax=Amborella trichopoda TaxID=13333 RepID=W1PE82_AMBTC|nr:hypothetical protein AMTR_s00145p00034190 [Amborella trichopoda]
MPERNSVFHYHTKSDGSGFSATRSMQNQEASRIIAVQDSPIFPKYQNLKKHRRLALNGCNAGSKKQVEQHFVKTLKNSRSFSFLTQINALLRQYFPLLVKIMCI